MDTTHEPKTIHGFEGKYSFLSNFYACETYYPYTLTRETPYFPTSEHAYQAMKAIDEDDADSIRCAPTPDQAKRIAHKITVRKDWEDIKDDIMLAIVRAKFTNPVMRQRLILTLIKGYEDMVEDNYWHDNYWGNCTCERCKNIVGQNKLGKILKQVREEIIYGED